MARLKTTKYLHPEPLPSNPHGSHIHHRGFMATPDVYTNVVGRALGEASNFYGKIIDNPVAERITNGILQKGWRALLFTNRAGLTHRINHLGSKEDFQGENLTGKLNYYWGPSANRTEIGLKQQIQRKFSEEHNKNGISSIFVGHDLVSLFGEGGKRSGYQVQYNDIMGKSQTYDPTDLNQVILYNMSAVTEEGQEKPFIALQIRPNIIESKAETSWATIKSMGRNLPMYHYLGGEDTLQINTSWYLKGIPGEPGFNPYWVVNQCRLLKSWSMANGYTASPPIIYIQWGRGDIFQGELWILHSATFHLSNFSDKVVVKKNNFVELKGQIPDKQVELLDFGLVPFTATQELIFKRVSSHNLLSPEIANLLEINSNV